MNDLNQRKAEVATKLTRLRQWMADRQLDAIQLNHIANTSWITAGAATYVGEASDGGPSSILVTPDHAYVLTDTIEGPRLQQDEKLADLGFEPIIEYWHSRGKLTQPLIEGKRIEYDSPGLRDLRIVLLPEEADRLRQISKLAAEAMDQAIRRVRPGDSEYQAAAYLAEASRERGGSPIVNLIASDERIYQFRHPLPTAKKIERYVMLVLCFRYMGLIASVTRLIHFGPMPDELRQKAMTVARIDAKLISGTISGRTMQDMFNLAKRAYEAEGYPDAINEHHQGGIAGYNPREAVAHPEDQTPIQRHQAFAWNPSVRGTKSEDTIYLGEGKPEILTVIPGWPTWEITVDGDTIQRPAILEV